MHSQFTEIPDPFDHLINQTFNSWNKSLTCKIFALKGVLLHIFGFNIEGLIVE